MNGQRRPGFRVVRGGKARPTKRELVDAIADATRAAAQLLFREHAGEHFYYCALITTGEASPPCLAAWSYEALDAAVRAAGGDAKLREIIKWSYADSPFYPYAEELFVPVRELFDKLEPMDFRDDASWSDGYEFRLSAMVAAMKRVEREGLFGRGKQRENVVVNVEVMPPDATNTERALELNPRAAVREWLREAAEQ